MDYTISLLESSVLFVLVQYQTGICDFSSSERLYSLISLHESVFWFIMRVLAVLFFFCVAEETGARSDRWQVFWLDEAPGVHPECLRGRRIKRAPACRKSSYISSVERARHHVLSTKTTITGASKRALGCPLCQKT